MKVPELPKCDPASVLKENKGRVHFYLDGAPTCQCGHGPNLELERAK